MLYDQVLKTHTREVLYEKYRTEKLLARRATRKIGEEQAKKLLEGVSSFDLLITCSALSPHSDLGL
jgi:septin family protein